MLRPSPNRHRRPRRRRPLRVEPLESRKLLSATPLGATVEDTGEFLLGSVAVTPVFLESDGTVDPETQQWNAGEVDDMLAKVSEGVNWWSETLAALGSVHTLDFTIDDTYALDPFETPYEPIDRDSGAFQEYVGGFLETLGYGDATSLEAAIHRFNHDQRTKLGTDWAFTLFVADSSEDDDGLFASGGTFRGAFAFPGGQFLVTPSTRPASTIAHEMGHIFWARDEYPGAGSWTDTRGYYDAQNLNASDNPTPGFEQEISIMRGGHPLAQAYDQHVSPESTLAMVGWRDSDGDGIFDVADVPLNLEATGYFDAETSLYHFTGHAAAVPLLNQNSSGHQSDITLGRVSRLQYSLDGEPWITAAQPDAQTADFDLAIDLPTDFSTIRWRVIDDATGVASEVIESAALTPAVSHASTTGFAFLDSDTNSDRAASEPLLPGTTVTVRQSDGSPLPGGAVEASDFADSLLPESIGGVTISAEGVTFSGEVGVFASSRADGRQVFQAFDEQQNQWQSDWTGRMVFTADFDRPVGEVEMQAIGLGRTSYGRLEAYDAAGTLIARSTTAPIAEGDAISMKVADASGRIARIRAFGHASTGIALSGIHYGFQDTVMTGPGGSWSLPNLPDGQYQLELQPELVIHQFDQPVVSVEVAGGSSAAVASAARRVPSPRHNLATAEDVNANEEVTALDALVVINDLNRDGARALSADETEGTYVDVNDDGRVSAIDALLIINALNRRDLATSEGESVGTAPAPTDPAGSELHNRAGSGRTGAASVAGTAAEPSPSGAAGTAAAADEVFAAWPVAKGESLAAAAPLGGAELLQHAGRLHHAEPEWKDFVSQTADEDKRNPRETTVPANASVAVPRESRIAWDGSEPEEQPPENFDRGTAATETLAIKLAETVKPGIAEPFPGPSV